MCLEQGATRGLSGVEAAGRCSAPAWKCLWTEGVCSVGKPPLLTRLHLRLSLPSSPPLTQSQSASPSSKPSLPKSNNSSSSSSPRSQNHSRLGLQRGAQLIGPKRAGQSRGGPCYTSLLSAGGCGDGLLELLAADLAGAGLQEQVVAGVADQHRVIQLLVWDGQLQMTTVFTEHIATVPEDGEHTESQGYFHFNQKKHKHKIIFQSVCLCSFTWLYTKKLILNNSNLASEASYKYSFGAIEELRWLVHESGARLTVAPKRHKYIQHKSGRKTIYVLDNKDFVQDHISGQFSSFGTTALLSSCGKTYFPNLNIWSSSLTHSHTNSVFTRPNDKWIKWSHLTLEKQHLHC